MSKNPFQFTSESADASENLFFPPVLQPDALVRAAIFSPTECTARCPVRCRSQIAFCNCLGSPKATTGESPVKAIPTFLLTGPMCICFFWGKHIYDKFYGAIVVLKNIHHLQYPPEIFTASLLSWSKPPCKAPQCEM